MKGGRAAARRLVIRQLISRQEIGSQQALVKLLAARGHRVNQTTVSRDLATIEAEKVPTRRGRLRYRLRGGTEGSERAGVLARIMGEFVVAIEPSKNIVVLKTPPGAANAVAAALDRLPPRDVLGTVAGDDTVLVVTRSSDGGTAVARRLRKILEV